MINTFSYHLFQKGLASLTLASALLTTTIAEAQTLNVHVGSVTYAHIASQTGDMTYGALQLTIQGKTYPLSSISSITIENSQVSDNTVSVLYQGSVAQVTVAGNLAAHINVKVSGADVSVIADSTYTEPISYTLSGNSTNGSFYMDGEAKATVTLDNLSLTSTSRGAITIDDGKKIDLTLNGNNILADAANGLQRACLFINGHADIDGEGSLEITGNARHGYFSDEYTHIKSGTITVRSATSDGFHINEYFQMDGGTININAHGDGVDVGAKAKGGTNNGQMILQGGTLAVQTDGLAAKALKADSAVTVSGGVINAKAIGTATYETAQADISGAAALKCGGTFTMTGGSLTLQADGDGGKGINADGDITVDNGYLTAVTTGRIFAYGALDTKPHAIKTDGNIIINGGTVNVAASDDGRALSTDFTFNINGGTVMAIGGKKCEPTGGRQTYKTYRGVSVSAGSTVTRDGVSFTVPTNYSISGARILVSRAGL